VLVACGCAVLLAGPMVIAFFAGGYFQAPQTWAGLIVWVFVAVAMLTSPRSLPRGASAWVAVGGLALLAAWTLISMAWAPSVGGAYHAGQRIVMYLGVLLAAIALLSGSLARRAVEPTLTAGALIVICYGVSERLLPGALHFHRSVTAEGRLEQPLTYWNAMGELAAIGLVLAVRLAGDVTRGSRMRVAAAAASVPLGLGLYLSFSRGALFACAAGLLTLVVAAPQRAQLRAMLLSICATVLASLSATPFGAVTSLSGSQATRERQGAIVLLSVVAITVAAGVAQWFLQRREPGGQARLPRHAGWISVGFICAGLAVAVVAGAKERAGQPNGASATRYVSLQSNRYNYWRVAWRAFRDEPLRGVGAGGWAVYWLRYRPILEGAQDAHSLPLQTLAELGVIGLALLAVFLAGIGIAARRAYRLAGVLCAGPLAAFVTWVAHQPLDWDWQMPAVTLIAIVLAGLLISQAEPWPRRDARAAHGEAAGGRETSEVLAGASPRV